MYAFYIENTLDIFFVTYNRLCYGRNQINSFKFRRQNYRTSNYATKRIVSYIVYRANSTHKYNNNIIFQ